MLLNEHISSVITRLRVISTLIIVIYHAACPYGGWEAFTRTINIEGGQYSSMEVINFIFQKLLCNTMLPMFFSLSGMLFYSKRERDKRDIKMWGGIFWNKFDRLIIPAALVFLFCSFFNIPFVGHAGAEGHLWFVYVLFLYFCWVMLLRKVNVHVLMFLATIGYIIYTLSGRLDFNIPPFILQLLRYQIYFIYGYYLFKYYNLLRRNFIRWPLLIIHLISLWLNFQTGYYLLFNLVAIAFIPQKNIENHIMKSLNNNSFGIYLIHHVLIIALFQVNFVCQSYINFPLIAIISMSLSALVASLLLNEVLHKIKFHYF